MRGFGIVILFTFFTVFSFAQMGTVMGKIVDKTNKGFPNIQVTIITQDNSKHQTTTNIEGDFSLKVPPGKHQLIYKEDESNKLIDIEVQEGQILKLDKIKLNIQYLEGVDVSGKSKDLSINELPVIEIHQIPGPTNSVEKYITYTTAASSNNELTSNYNVRGGSYDENLIYVNGFEIYRPFLTRSGEQEGMSFINPNLVESIAFSAGGFTANYGDRLSSVLDITYRSPTAFHGSFDASMLGVSAHVEDKVGARFNFLAGGRYQNKGYLLNALPIKGTYKPVFYDFQLLTNFYIKENLVWSVLGHFSSNNYNFAPETQETKLGTINNPLSFKVYFEGQERTKFQTITGATSLKWQANKRTNIALYAQIFNTDERENFDILGEYYINELEKDPAKEEYGDSIGTLGVGAYLNHARNQLKATIYSLRLEGGYQFLKISEDGLDHDKKGKIDWGINGQYEDFKDVISEWGLIDSAGYSLPQTNPYEVTLKDVIKANNTLSTFRTSGFIQYSQTFDKVKELYPISIKVKKKDESGTKVKYTFKDTVENSRSQFAFNTGVRMGYTAFNHEFYVTPRAMVSYFPRVYYLDKEETLKKRYIRIYAGTGLYYQPPFYRELRRFNGELYTDTKSQKSFHFVAGTEFTFNMWDRKTPFKLTSELFYKYMWDVNPYYIDNVRLRYFAENNAIGHAYGMDFQLNGEFIDGVQSFFKLGLLRSIEDLNNDDYYTYYNSDGEKIIPGYTFNNVPTDSILNSPGFIPKPTDQWVTFATLFQDRMPKLEQLTAQLGLHFGSKLPYGPPGHERYKDVLRQKAYFRVDIGFGWDFLYKKPNRETRKKMFRPFTDIRLNFEIFNLLGFKNVLSQQWVQDTEGRYIAIPNYLTQRRFNLKLIIRW
ncbi:MAG: carboxypeptidase regulatory-like domain-containing protein [Brumimicrobium sp.]|nr:carboxypeptidase regulatory-like domain-containing protein [Brumimicrobium sp.]